MEIGNQIKALRQRRGITQEAMAQHLNITPHQYVLMKKMSLAKEFLAKGETVSEACFNAGFDNYAYFITCFKKIFGVTPGKHKKSTD